MLAPFGGDELTSDGRYKKVWNGGQKMIRRVEEVRCRDGGGGWGNWRESVE